MKIMQFQNKKEQIYYFILSGNFGCIIHQKLIPRVLQKINLIET